MTIKEISAIIKSSKWVSLSIEMRPAIAKTKDDIIKPLFCSREFTFYDNQFTLKFKNFADPYGKVPLAVMDLAGHIKFGDRHPIADGAYEIDYVADLAFALTLLDEQLAAGLNKSSAAKSGQWSVNEPKDVLGKSVPAFGLQAGQPFREYDLIYVHHDMLFNGARHPDGRPFDKPENRPANLQIPLIKADLA